MTRLRACGLGGHPGPTGPLLTGCRQKWERRPCCALGMAATWRFLVSGDSVRELSCCLHSAL